MKIFDCFPFYNEFEILELKFQILYDRIDYFVIGESNKTFTGKDKPLYYKLNKERFLKYADKIIHVEITDSPLPFTKNWCWNVEFFQRSALIRGLSNIAQINDIIIASDVDEIINPEIIPTLLVKDEWLSPELNLYYYFINIKAKNIGIGPSIARYGTFRSIEQIRLASGKNKRIKNGGWHFTFMGGADKITEKLSSYAESQTNKEDLKSKDLINFKIANKIDLFNRKGYTYEIADIEEYPDTIIAFCKDNSHMVFHDENFKSYKSEKYHQLYADYIDDYSKRSIFYRILKRIYKLYWLYIK